MLRSGLCAAEPAAPPHLPGPPLALPSMAGHHQSDWFQREELIGQISDIRVQNLQVERENVQKRTFTRWINLHLEKCKPPLHVQDLFIDIQDGKILMALLEVLSGQSLLHEYKSSSHRIFRLNNIAKALMFLETCNVKLVSIDAAEIADGNSSLILGLIWNIILFFKIKEFTGSLNKMASSSSLSSVPSCPDSDTSQPGTPNTEKSMSVSVKDQRKAIKALLSWVQERTRKYGVAVQDFANSWRSGLAFLAVIKAIDSSLVNMKQALERSSQENLEEAFNIAHRNLGIPKLLEPEDLIVEAPDEQSIMTYVAQFLEHFPEVEGEDFSKANADNPVETTYARIKDGPKEQEGTVFIVNENGDCAITISHESTQPLPQKINLCTELDGRETQSVNAQVKSNGDLNPSLKVHSKPLVEEDVPPALLPTEPHRSNSWHVLGTVHVPPNDSWHDLANKWPHCIEISENDAQKMSRETTLIVSPTEKNAVDQSHSELLPLEAPRNYSSSMLTLTDAFKQSSKALDTSLNTPGISDTESFSSAADEPDSAIFQTEERSSEEASSIMAPLIEENDHNILMKSKKEEETIKYILHLQEEEAFRKPPIGCEHPQEISGLQPLRVNVCLTDDSRQKDEPDLYGTTRSEIVVHSSQKSLEPPTYHNGDGSTSEASPSPSKVSVIPHDLFYYPHYSVPISDVLDAFVKPDPYDSKNDGVNDEFLLNGVQEQEENHGGGQQALTKTTNGMFPAQMSKSTSENVTSDACLDLEFQEVASELANVSFSDVDTIKKEKIDPVSHTAQDVFFSAETDSVLRRELPENELNYSELRKTDSTSNGTTRIEEDLEFVENQFEDASPEVLGPEMCATKNKKDHFDEAQERDFQSRETRSAHFPDKTDGDSFGNVCFLRPTSSDTSINYQHYNSTASDTDLNSEIEQNESIFEETNIRHRKKVKWEDEPEPKICSEPEALSLSERFPDVLYFLLLLWLLIYLVLILPELSVSKLAFLQQ